MRSAAMPRFSSTIPDFILFSILNHKGKGMGIQQCRIAVSAVQEQARCLPYKNWML